MAIKKRKKALVLTVFITFVVGIIFTAIYMQRLNNSLRQEQLEQIFHIDSLNISSIKLNDLIELSKLDSLRSTLKINADRYKYDSLKVLPLLKNIENCQTVIMVGKIYTDEFTGETIKLSTKEVATTYKEYLANKEKYLVEHIPMGYLNSANKKAHRLNKKYGWRKDECIKVAKRLIWIGMTKEMCLESWGKPRDINRTVGSWGTHEQWVYNEQYVYFENNILTSWQD